jgi:branched-chain amino acid transport system ATP-binding protein
VSETLDIIRAEHRRLASVLTCFIGVLNDIKDRNLAPDLALFEQVVIYLEAFLYQFHHPKEDEHLFHRVLARSGRSVKKVIQRLEDEHGQGRVLLTLLRKNLDRYRATPNQENFMAFYNMAMVYRDFEWYHMGVEEREILPLAEEILTEADWAELDALFTAHDDPVFGRQPQEEFNTLAAKIINQAPAPHGLGA